VDDAAQEVQFQEKGYALMDQFLRMFQWGFEGSLFVLMTPIGWGLIVLAMITGWVAVLDKKWPVQTWCFLAWPLLMSILVIAWGQANWHEPGQSASDPKSRILMCFMGVYLLGAGVAIYFNRRGRAATTAVLSLGSFLFLGCTMVSAMAITGNWL
jgi:hypothetical protein